MDERQQKMEAAQRAMQAVGMNMDDMLEYMLQKKVKEQQNQNQNSMQMNNNDPTQYSQYWQQQGQQSHPQNTTNNNLGTNMNNMQQNMQQNMNVNTPMNNYTNLQQEQYQQQQNYANRNQLQQDNSMQQQALQAAALLLNGGKGNNNANASSSSNSSNWQNISHVNSGNSNMQNNAAAALVGNNAMQQQNYSNDPINQTTNQGSGSSWMSGSDQQWGNKNAGANSTGSWGGISQNQHDHQHGGINNKGNWSSSGNAKGNKSGGKGNNHLHQGNNNNYTSGAMQNFNKANNSWQDHHQGHSSGMNNMNVAASDTTNDWYHDGSTNYSTTNNKTTQQQNQPHNSSWMSSIAARVGAGSSSSSGGNNKNQSAADFVKGLLGTWNDNGSSADSNMEQQRNQNFSSTTQASTTNDRFAAIMALAEQQQDTSRNSSTSVGNNHNNYGHSNLQSGGKFGSAVSAAKTKGGGKHSKSNSASTSWNNDSWSSATLNKGNNNSSASSSFTNDYASAPHYTAGGSKGASTSGGGTSAKNTQKGKGGGKMNKGNKGFNNYNGMSKASGHQNNWNAEHQLLSSAQDQQQQQAKGKGKKGKKKGFKSADPADKGVNCNLRTANKNLISENILVTDAEQALRNHNLKANKQDYERRQQERVDRMNSAAGKEPQKDSKAAARGGNKDAAKGDAATSFLLDFTNNIEDILCRGQLPSTLVPQGAAASAGAGANKRKRGEMEQQQQQQTGTNKTNAGASTNESENAQHTLKKPKNVTDESKVNWISKTKTADGSEGVNSENIKPKSNREVLEAALRDGEDPGSESSDEDMSSPGPGSAEVKDGAGFVGSSGQHSLDDKSTVLAPTPKTQGILDAESSTPSTSTSLRDEVGVQSKNNPFLFCSDATATGFMDNHSTTSVQHLPTGIINDGIILVPALSPSSPGAEAEVGEVNTAIEPDVSKAAQNNHGEEDPQPTPDIVSVDGEQPWTPGSEMNAGSFGGVGAAIDVACTGDNPFLRPPTKNSATTISSSAKVGIKVVPAVVVQEPVLAVRAPEALPGRVEPVSTEDSAPSSKSVDQETKAVAGGAEEDKNKNLQGGGLLLREEAQGGRDEQEQSVLHLPEDKPTDEINVAFPEQLQQQQQDPCGVVGMEIVEETIIEEEISPSASSGGAVASAVAGEERQDISCSGSALMFPAEEQVPASVEVRGGQADTEDPAALIEENIVEEEVLSPVEAAAPFAAPVSVSPVVVEAAAPDSAPVLSVLATVAENDVENNTSAAVPAAAFVRVEAEEEVVGAQSNNSSPSACSNAGAVEEIKGVIKVGAATNLKAKNVTDERNELVVGGTESSRTSGPSPIVPEDHPEQREASAVDKGEVLEQNTTRPSIFNNPGTTTDDKTATTSEIKNSGKFKIPSVWRFQPVVSSTEDSSDAEEKKNKSDIKLLQDEEKSHAVSHDLPPTEQEEVHETVDMALHATTSEDPIPEIQHSHEDIIPPPRESAALAACSSTSTWCYFEEEQEEEPTATIPEPRASAALAEDPTAALFAAMDFAEDRDARKMSGFDYSEGVHEMMNGGSLGGGGHGNGSGTTSSLNIMNLLGSLGTTTGTNSMTTSGGNNSFQSNYNSSTYGGKNHHSTAGATVAGKSNAGPYGKGNKSCNSSYNSWQNHGGGGGGKNSGTSSTSWWWNNPDNSTSEQYNAEGSVENYPQPGGKGGYNYNKGNKNAYSHINNFGKNYGENKGSQNSYSASWQHSNDSYKGGNDFNNSKMFNNTSKGASMSSTKGSYNFQQNNNNYNYKGGSSFSSAFDKNTAQQGKSNNKSGSFINGTMGKNANNYHYGFYPGGGAKGSGKPAGQIVRGKFYCRYCDYDCGDNEFKWKQHCKERHIQCIECGESLPEYAMEAHMLTHCEDDEEKDEELEKWIASRKAKFPTKKRIQEKQDGTVDDSHLPLSKIEEQLREKIDPQQKKKLRPQDDDETVEVCLQYEYFHRRCGRGKQCPFRHRRRDPWWMQKVANEEEFVCNEAEEDQLGHGDGAEKGRLEVVVLDGYTAGAGMNSDTAGSSSSPAGGCAAVKNAVPAAPAGEKKSEMTTTDDLAASEKSTEDGGTPKLEVVPEQAEEILTVRKEDGGEEDKKAGVSNTVLPPITDEKETFIEGDNKTKTTTVEQDKEQTAATSVAEQAQAEPMSKSKRKRLKKQENKKAAEKKAEAEGSTTENKTSSSLLDPLQASDSGNKVGAQTTELLLQEATAAVKQEQEKTYTFARGVCHAMIHKKKCMKGENCTWSHEHKLVLEERAKWRAIFKQDKEAEKRRNEQPAGRSSKVIKMDDLFRRIEDKVDVSDEVVPQVHRYFSSLRINKSADGRKVQKSNKRKRADRTKKTARGSSSSNSDGSRSEGNDSEGELDNGSGVESDENSFFSDSDDLSNLKPIRDVTAKVGEPDPCRTAKSVMFSSQITFKPTNLLKATVTTREPAKGDENSSGPGHLQKSSSTTASSTGNNKNNKSAKSSSAQLEEARRVLEFLRSGKKLEEGQMLENKELLDILNNDDEEDSWG
ncbi:unnamed protein product [Amoebophrya sp. A120]|nr:unnamed protein product [Amoebophrya sp. A120]|eukprot:GSA120T00008339001.1